MARPNWEYIRVDVLLPRNPKLDGLNATAKWTLIELWIHCGQLLTDGFVRDRIWRTIGTPAARRKIVERGLAERVPGGYQMHDYLEHQRSRAEVEALRKKRAVAGRKGGLAKASATASASRLPVKQPFSKPSKSLAEAEAEAEAEADRSVADVDRSSSGGHARALDRDDDLIIDRIKTRTNHAVSRDEVRAIRDLVIAGRQVSDPLAYVLRAIDDEPDPVRRFLNGSASEAGRHPSAAPLASICKRCGASHPTQECPV